MENKKPNKQRKPFASRKLNSRSNWWKWLKNLSIETVIETQHLCRDMMKLMGYTAIHSKKDIDLASLITNFCLNQNITFCLQL